PRPVAERGFAPGSAGTDNHLSLRDLTPKGIPGKPAAKALDRAGIETNYNTVPFDPRKPFDPSGIRIGTPAITTRGLREEHMQQIAAWMDEVVTAALKEDEPVIDRIASEGAAGLSLRAAARELGMVSSAVYRYFPSRDDLLTALIIDGYNAIGAAAEQADAACRRGDHRGRWLSACRSVRDWALAHPHEYSLVYGSPVPGYRAPEQTIGPQCP